MTLLSSPVSFIAQARHGGQVAVFDDGKGMLAWITAAEAATLAAQLIEAATESLKAAIEATR